VPGVGQYRGRYHADSVFTIRRRFDRIDFVALNHSLYFDPKSPLRRSASANVSEAVLASVKIDAEDKKGVLINAGKLFLNESLLMVKYPSSGDSDRFALGKLSESKTHFHELRNYRNNTNVIVDYVYDNSDPKGEPGEEITDPRYVTVRMQHSFLAMPDNDYQPRFADARVGYFTTEVNDMTTASSAPWRDMINRWHLVPKDPTAEVKDPVKPITWWIENTTPRELRPIIRQAALRWNEAFLQAGWENAIRIRVQPDDADWDAGDIRYNVLRWTSSNDPPFGGYGPSFVNPRTGQILGADIMLEHVFLTNRIRYSRLLTGQTAGAEARERENGLAGLAPRHRGGRAHVHVGCDCASLMQEGSFLGRMMLRAAPVPVDFRLASEERLLREGLSRLILHEIGHTLGLTHNFRASQLHPLQGVLDRKLTDKEGVTASVMDYSALNLSRDLKSAPQFYDDKPGIYDRWAIEYGYSPALDDPEKETLRLKSILTRSTERGHDYANDADDMRRPGKGVNPRVMIGDMTSEPVKWQRERSALVRELALKLLETVPVEGDSYQELRVAWNILRGQDEDALHAISRYVGGLEVDRSLVGQDGAGETPLAPVDAELQRAAMASLAEHAFGEKVLRPSPELARHLQLQRRGFHFFDETEDPKISDYVIDLQRGILAQLLHSRVQNRILDTTRYGNDYPLTEVMEDLTEAVFSGPENDDLQLLYVERLSSLLKNNSLYPAGKAVAHAQLLSAKDVAGDDATGVYLKHLVDQALESD